MIVEAVRAKGLPVAYVTFEGEQHGFRQAANIRAALDAELAFYSEVLRLAWSVPRTPLCVTAHVPEDLCGDTEARGSDDWGDLDDARRSGSR